MDERAERWTRLDARRCTKLSKEESPEDTIKRLLDENEALRKAMECFQLALIDKDEETRELICIGSTNKGRVKVQITSKKGCDKYEIRCEPQIMALKKGEAVEFEVFLYPLCSFVLEEEIAVVCLNLKIVLQK